jgi:hypothetical protein
MHIDQYSFGHIGIDGHGYCGRMQVREETLDVLRGAGIDVRVEKTASAVEEFNRLQREWARIVAALHLTC